MGPKKAIKARRNRENERGTCGRTWNDTVRRQGDVHAWEYDAASLKGARAYTNASLWLIRSYGQLTHVELLSVDWLSRWCLADRLDVSLYALSNPEASWPFVVDARKKKISRIKSRQRTSTGYLILCIVDKKKTEIFSSDLLGKCTAKGGHNNRTLKKIFIARTIISLIRQI